VLSQEYSPESSKRLRGESPTDRPPHATVCFELYGMRPYEGPMEKQSCQNTVITPRAGPTCWPQPSWLAPLPSGLPPTYSSYYPSYSYPPAMFPGPPPPYGGVTTAFLFDPAPQSQYAPLPPTYVPVRDSLPSLDVPASIFYPRRPDEVVELHVWGSELPSPT
jgi:hypothetical protein